MAQDFSKQFYNSKAWKRCREAYIAQRRLIDGGICEVCHKRIGYIVHHKIMITEQNIHNAEIVLNHANMRYECKQCHDLEEGHFYDQHGLKKPAASFGPDGQPIDVRRI